MKTFKYNYSALIIFLLIAVILTVAAGLVFNVISVIEYSKIDTFKTVIYGLLTALNFALFLLAVSVAIYGRYKIKNGYLYSFFGFIFTKTPIEKIVQITHFKKSDKLVIYFKEGKYSVVIISPEKYADFTRELLKLNPDIVCDFNTEDPAL